MSETTKRIEEIRARRADAARPRTTTDLSLDGRSIDDVPEDEMAAAETFEVIRLMRGGKCIGTMAHAPVCDTYDGDDVDALLAALDAERKVLDDFRAGFAVLQTNRDNLAAMIQGLRTHHGTQAEVEALTSDRDTWKARAEAAEKALAERPEITATDAAAMGWSADMMGPDYFAAERRIREAIRAHAQKAGK